MFIITAKIDRKKFMIGTISLLLLCGMFSVRYVSQHKADPTAAAKNSSIGEQKGIRTNEDRIRYLESYGWTVEDEANMIEELQFPDHFEDPIYNDFLSLQQSQGFRPEHYSGKRIKRYTYVITNYPGKPESVFADLYLYRHKVIGGEVFSSEANGFSQGLAMPN